MSKEFQSGIEQLLEVCPENPRVAIMCAEVVLCVAIECLFLIMLHYCVG